MTIYVGSRYEEDTVDRVRAGSEDYAAAVYHQAPPLVQVFSYGLHYVVQGDRLDMLAATYLGDAELSWVLANANPELFYPDDIPAGTVLRIPNVRIR